MKIFKHAENSTLFRVDEITDEQLIALMDIAKNYHAYLNTIIKLPDSQLKEFIGGESKHARMAIRLQIQTCIAYEMAFSEVVNAGEQKKPLDN
jgi:hypothetical protein